VSGIYVHTIAPMGTIVTIQVVGHDETEEACDARADGVSRAAAWFEAIEKACSRFDPSSELRQLCAKVATTVAASPMLFETIRFALKLAEDSDGAFDARGDGLIETLRVSDTAVCTSGDYERRSPNEPRAHHIMDARSGDTASRLASVTVMAPSAMVADACATAAFALGPDEGARFLERHGLRGILVTPSRERIDIGAAI